MIAPPDPRPPRKLLRLYWIVGIVIYAITAWNSVGYFHADEHFQILEFANYKSGDLPASALAWEFGAQIRPGLQVAIAWFAIEAFEWIGITDPFIIATFLRSISAALSLLALWLIYQASQPYLQTKAAHHFYLTSSVILWFMPYIGVRFSSETFSGSIFFLAVGWLMLARSKMVRLEWLLTGFLLGISFDLRYQAGILIAGILIWLVIKQNGLRQERFYLIMSGISIAVIIGVLADRWLYGEWVFSAWEYARVNLLEGKASEFGTRPWYYYFERTISGATPTIGALILLSIGTFWWRSRHHPFTWASILFVIVHMLIAHKELRFLFPLIFMIPLSIAHLTQIKAFRSLQKPVVIVILLLLDLPLLLHRMFQPASDHVQALQVTHHFQKEGPVTLFHSAENPFDPWGLEHSFYSRDHAYTLQKIQNVADLPVDIGAPAIYYTPELSLQDHAPSELDLQLIDQTYPRWITEHFNINGWVERTRIRAIYRVEKAG